MEDSLIAPAHPELSEFIRNNLPILAVPGVPELRLHKAVPTSGLWRLAEADLDFDNPYWAYHWGGGLALARHILNQPGLVAGRRILDLGAGSGLVAIAAMRAGATTAVAADVDAYALTASIMNAKANGVEITTMLGDLTDGAAPDVEVVLVGDLFYEARLAQRVSAFLDRCLAAGMDVLIGDPWRAYLPRARLELLAEYPGGDFGGGTQADLALNAVFRFRTARPYS